MLKHRLIPVLLLQGGQLVRSESFKTHQVIGNPVNEVDRFNEWNVDELIYLDITRDGAYNVARRDHRVTTSTEPLDILEQVSASCFMPLTWGGRIRGVDDMRACFRRGADKVAVNSEAFRTPSLVREAAELFGSQALVVSIDAGAGSRGPHTVFIDGGRTDTGVGVADWAVAVEELGAGEILLQSLERDGTGNGYDTDLISAVSERTSIPIIACSGAGQYDDYAEALRAGASAVAAANIWHFKELADRGGKRALRRAGFDVRFDEV